MLVFPLHVVDVPRHPGHGVDGLLDDVVALVVGIKVLCNFLFFQNKSAILQSDISSRTNRTCELQMLLHLKQQVILEDPLDRLEQVGAQRQRALEGGLPIPEELGQSFAPHAVGQRGH